MYPSHETTLTGHETTLTGCQFFFEAPSFSGKPAEGLWNNDAKTLVLRLTENVAAATPLEFSWFLKNPEIGQDSPEISIVGQSENMTLAPQRFLRDVANKSPLLIAKLERHLIQQSTSQAGMSNTFVIDLVFNIDFENATLVFSGLVTVCFQGPCPGCIISPPPGRSRQKARDGRGLGAPGSQEAGAGLSRAPAPSVPASPSRMRAPAPFSGPMPGVQR